MSEGAVPDRTAGSTLVEVLAALTLLAVAGSVVAAAAMTNLRALRAATTLEYLVTIASRELAIAESRGAVETVNDATLQEPGLASPVQRHLVVTRNAAGVATLEAVVSTTNAPPLTLATRMLVPE